MFELVQEIDKSNAYKEFEINQVTNDFKVTTHSNNRNSKSSREVILGSVRL